MFLKLIGFTVTLKLLHSGIKFILMITPFLLCHQDLVILVLCLTLIFSFIKLLIHPRFHFFQIISQTVVTYNLSIPNQPTVRNVAHCVRRMQHSQNAIKQVNVTFIARQQPGLEQSKKPIFFRLFKLGFTFKFTAFNVQNRLKLFTHTLTQAVHTRARMHI